MENFPNNKEKGKNALKTRENWGEKRKPKAPFGILFVFYFFKMTFLHRKLQVLTVDCLQSFYPRCLFDNKK